jgi:hypothetical protein
VTLQVITLEEMLAHSALAEVQALTDSEEDGSTLAPLETNALDLLESELGRRLTVDATAVTVKLLGSGLTLLALPERLDSFTRVYSETLGDVTTSVETTVNGWLLQGLYPHRYHWRSPVTITGKWGLTCPERVKGVLMDVIEAMAVRKGDPVSRRDELAPWGAISDGGLRADRDSSFDRQATLENLLRYDMKVRLRGFYLPDIVAVV